ncbi:hypothetical protein EVAR_40777_1 [Eumeta japonica]|uniref:Uncharacterized protein n=1 Tax=Eumeta variegata TaxID=151549 RepID=A0A4C1X2G5_EUMVA|nr:hypothetical protein EVAR_40777_1 [Eumeta japonica]
MRRRRYSCASAGPASPSVIVIGYCAGNRAPARAIAGVEWQLSGGAPCADIWLRPQPCDGRSLGARTLNTVVQYFGLIFKERRHPQIRTLVYFSRNLPNCEFNISARFIELV